MDLRSGLGARLGYDPFEEQADETYFVEIYSRENGSGYRADLSIDEPGYAKQQVQKLVKFANDCGELGEATILAIAVAIEPSVGLARGGSDVSREKNN